MTKKGASNDGKKVNNVDFLVKMNLSPLMGRRDAAYDQAVNLLCSDLFSQPDEIRRKNYEQIIAFLNDSINDSEAIILTLSNNDMSIREQRNLSFLCLLRNVVTAADNLIMFEEKVFSGDLAINKFLGNSASRLLSKNVNTLSDCEMRIIHSAVDLINNAAPKVERYRDFTNKSFSHHNAQRYNNALSEYKAYYLQIASQIPKTNAD